MNKKMLFDTHVHLNDDVYEKTGHTIKKILQEANENGVGYFLNCAYDLPSSQLAIQQANEFDNVFVAVGIHPNEVSNYQENAFAQLDDLTKNEKVVAIGEVGLDYFYQKKDMELQKHFFKEQIKLAQKNNLTLMMHIRDHKDIYDAYDDVLEILKDYKTERMIVHCFSANLEYAQKFIDLGCWINIGGAVTFKNAKVLQHAVESMPIEKILLETDAPYLTPHPHRGQLNFSKFITLTAQKIAELKGLEYDLVVKITTSNAFAAFNIKK